MKILLHAGDQERCKPSRIQQNVQNFISKSVRCGKLRTARAVPQEGANAAHPRTRTNSVSTVGSDTTHCVAHYCAAFTGDTNKFTLFLIP